MNSKQVLIAIQMTTDLRLPESALISVDNLSDASSPAIIAASLKKLSLYVPELVDGYRAAETQPEFIFSYTELSDESKHTARETIIEILHRKHGLDRSQASAIFTEGIKTDSFDVFGNRIFPLQ